MIQHDVTSPRPYSRIHLVSGTKGIAQKWPGPERIAFGHKWVDKTELEGLYSKYTPPLIQHIGNIAKEVGGHGGMDFIMDYRLIHCLQNGLPLDMDVYDLAEWCCLAELGELSMDNNCAPVAFPDFTRGEWNVVKGYKHAYASPEDEAAAMEKAKAFTAKLKEQGAKEWVK